MKSLHRWLYGLAATTLFAATCPAEVSRVELRPIPTTTLSDAQFLGNQADAPTATIAGELRIPKAGEKQPVVILLHGSNGYIGYLEQWVNLLNEMGIATFALDSLSGRNLQRVGDDQASLGRLATTYDAYRALDLLAADPRFDKERIVLMGFSRGGQATLYAAMQRFREMYEKPGNQFAGYIAFYPNCVTRYLDDTRLAARPVRIFHGEADDYNPVSACRDYVERLRTAGADVSLVSYPGAHHVFDWDRLSVPAFNPKAQSARACQLRETTPGRIINERTGEEFSYRDNCVQNGTTAAWEPKAAEAARSAVRALMTQWLQR